MGYADRPWLPRFAEGQPHDITPDFPDALTMFRAAVARNPDGDAIRYFDGAVTHRELDALTDAFAAGLLDAGFTAGERVAMYLQNVPQFVIGLVGTWKAGGVAVSVNPMNRERELDLLLRDSGASVLVCLESLYADVAAGVVAGTGVRTVLTTSERDFQTRDDPRAFGDAPRPDLSGAAVTGLGAFLERYRGTVPPAVSFEAGDTAFLTYTSGTTGPPKGAMNTHGNVVFNSQAYATWCDLGDDDVVLGVAPLFHITGLIAHVTLAQYLAVPLVLFHRFEPSLGIDVIREHRPTFTVGAITVFIALMNAPNAERSALASLTTIASGGAPIPPSTVTAFHEVFGHWIHNVYGLTETTSPSHGTPIGTQGPVDAASGALSVGVPIYNTVVRILDDEGAELPPGEVGEICTSGPQVVSGYWNKPEETATALHSDPTRPPELHTGDVGYMDEAGWFYIVDRKKDQINAGGYKVWPREVEDVLYEHPAVREAAVVGVPDRYRGETVKAFVSFRQGTSATPEELVAFTKERMAAYKYPRQVEILDEVPKTVTGKVLRRELRDRDPRG
ncbi:acyl-CoA synthetase [Pseudonocardia sp. EC080610-09]|uniref:AMP-binding protein n=1 Tax=unclassified Pseudonocardia TaxID=2619320 RepID=UPI0006CB0509|nr:MULTISPECIES: AMP-binding protein [unclassified Pseudonocardia]ALE72174.1 acyl-CoA synthetase [Pseudonocardia sp. EC080625-04]ALL75456.1 acyl-CoA synthetase [Pseudonocardia sp. EC080610-09]ALL82482.1 acyl-CoA synthetase [Pseudonocardia sp. EC080619-01]